MRNPVAYVLLAVALAAAPSLAAPAGPGKPPQQQQQQQQQFSPCGVKVGQQVIRPGTALPLVFGVAGPPDAVRAVRSKKEADDYVLFKYEIQGFSVDLNSKSNLVQGILVEGREAALDGVPFRIGDNKAAVQKAWGEPDRTQSNVMAYWRRGVYVGCDEAGNVINVFLAAPGKVDEPKGPTPSGPG